MPNPITNHALQNLDSLKLLKMVLSDYQEYFGEVILCLKNLNQVFQEKDFIKNLTLEESDKKELSDLCEKINKMLSDTQETNNFKLGLKIFAQGQHAVFYAKLLAIRNEYPALLSGANVQYERAAALSQALDQAADAANGAKEHRFNPDISIILQRLGAIIQKLPVFQLKLYWKEFIEKINSGKIQIENCNQVLATLTTRSAMLVVYYLFAYAQSNKYIENTQADYKSLVEKLMQDKTVGEMTKFISGKVSDLMSYFAAIATSYQEASTRAAKLDKIHDQVLRISYLNQAFSLKSKHTVGYCGGDIRAWCQSSLKEPIQKKTSFNHFSELHVEDASSTALFMHLNQSSASQRQAGGITTTTIKRHQAKTDLNSESFSSQPEEFRPLQEFIHELLNTVKETLSKQNYRGTVEVDLTKIGKSSGHAIGFKIFNQNGKLQIYFRDVNAGEFYTEDFAIFQKWFISYFCSINYHEMFDGFIIDHLDRKVKPQKKSTPLASDDSAETKLALEKTELKETKELKETDETLRNQILQLFPKFNDETQTLEIGPKIILLYKKIKNKNEQDHLIALTCYINFSQNYPDGTPEREMLCKKAVKIHASLVAISPEHGYNPLAHLNLAELYLQNFKFNKVKKGMDYLKMTCEAFMKIDSRNLLNGDPKIIHLLKKQAQGILNHLSGPVYAQHFKDLMKKFKALVKFFNENSEELLTAHTYQIYNNIFNHQVTELEYAEGELPAKEDETEAEGQQPAPENPPSPLHFQYKTSGPTLPENTITQDKPKSPAKP